ncbi:patatin-like protein [Arthrobacter terricola]|uniref:Patatin-like protein n=2 Tax=Arthrobacter TaxID=1663 RepID=A0A4R5KU13_9MICC|nr:patatin-like protein [Arthrobacter terricola]TDF98400.1 patatin-like protein [Arthrobacter terricola]
MAWMRKLSLRRWLPRARPSGGASDGGPAAEFDGRPGAAGPTREIRLALVCYGGVSLAVYMYGVTREILELVIASRLLESGETQDIAPETTRYAYVQALRESAKNHQGALPRVVVDIVSGTSAGGLDGLFLAKAMAIGRSLEPLKKLWLNQADVRTLMAGFGDVWFRLVEFVGRLVFTPDAAPLDGPGMVGLVSRSLQAIDNAPPITTGPLIPRGQSLDLFVPITDGAGHKRFLVLHPGGTILQDVSHRHVMHFRAVSGAPAENQFERDGNPVLAFAARTTSSFPGGFPPVTIEGFAQAFNALAQTGDSWDATPFKTRKFVKDFFDDYRGWGDDPRKTWFMDGGVLDNAPFDHAIKTIEHKRADTEVERYLVYIDPHPVPPLPNRKVRLPSWPGSMVAGATAIPAHQSILEGLVGLRHRNARIEQISDLTKGLESRIGQVLNDRGQRVTGTTEYRDVCFVEDDLARLAATEMGKNLEGYLQLRLEAIAVNLGKAVTKIFKYSEESSVAAFIREVLRAWALQKGQNANFSIDGLKGFFGDYDVPYQERRLRFLIQELNKLYEDRPDSAERALVDAAKTAVYDALESLHALPETLNSAAKTGAALFARVANKEPAALDPHGFARENMESLDSFLASLKSPRASQDTAFWNEFSGLLKAWPRSNANQAQRLLEAYAGYPLWDAVVYPILALSEIRQSKRIEISRISPEDGAVTSEGPKLKGTGLGQFAAFLRKDWRENDYLWGRLDATAKLLGLIQPGISSREVADALRTVLAEEAGLGILKAKTRGCVTKEFLEASIADLDAGSLTAHVAARNGP